MNSLPLTHNSTPGFRIPTGIRSHRELLKPLRFNVEISSKYCYNSKKRSRCSASGALSRREALIGVGIIQVVNPMKDLAGFAAESEVCELSVAPSGLGYCDKVVGTGAEALKGQLIKAHYVGRLEDGKVFDSSYNRGKPLTFRVGVGEVIKGWDEGIVGGDGVPAMLAGGKRKLRIPPQLGYGMRGAGCRGGSCIIPPDSVLLFDVEFVGKVAGAGN